MTIANQIILGIMTFIVGFGIALIIINYFLTDKLDKWADRDDGMPSDILSYNEIYDLSEKIEHWRKVSVAINWGLLFVSLIINVLA